MSRPPPPCVLVLFGANGDLATRMIYPALHALAGAGRLPSAYAVVGTGRHEPGDHLADVVREAVRGAARESDAKLDQEALGALADRVGFQASTADDGSDLAAAVQAAEQRVADEAGIDVDEVRRIVYLSIPPESMLDIVAMLGREGLTERARLLVEKPFGHDLGSSRALDAGVKELFDERDVYRVDHFLGIEAVQNVLALRFANRLFDAAWDRRSIASVQIDVPETLGLEGRGSFYEDTGCLRDMVSTHLCQILGLVAMEQPRELTARGLRDAKAEVFAHLRPFDKDRSVFGQYVGYRDDDDVDDDSQVETFVALETYVDNDRWRDVPFYLRTGKSMATDRRTVTVRFRDATPGLFDHEQPHQLVLDLTDDPVVAVEVRGKRPGPELEVAPARLVLDHAQEFVCDRSSAAYERLLLDVLEGDQLLFTRDDEVDRLWQVCQPLLDDPPPLQHYAAGSWGPVQAVALPERGWAVGERGA